MVTLPPASPLSTSMKLARGWQLMNNTELSYRLVPTLSGGKQRYIVVHKDTEQPHLALCLYEASLSRQKRRNTVRNALHNLLYLVSWTEIFGLDLESQLLAGQPFEAGDINAYAMHLSCRRTRWGPLMPGTVNGILSSAHLLSKFFQELRPPKTPQETTMRTFLARHENDAWSRAKQHVPSTFVSKILLPDQLQQVHDFLHPDQQAGGYKHRDVAVRSYVAWLYLRMFGLRGGELLSLRLSDLMMTSDCWLKVPATPNLHEDTRAPYSPATKTGARDLPLYEDPTEIRTWTQLYLDEYRVGNSEFFLTSRQRKPLSGSSLQKMSQRIRARVIDDFWLHRVRHTNAVEWLEIIVSASEDDNEHFRQLFDALEKRMGWNDARSSAPYLQAALRKLAQKRLERLVSR